jgi:hypothetical protein
MDRRGCRSYWSWLAIAAVSYADHRVLTLSLVYLYIPPLTVGAIFFRKGISYSLIAACILFHYFFHYFDAPRHIHLGVRIALAFPNFPLASSLPKLAG